MVGRIDDRLRERIERGAVGGRRARTRPALTEQIIAGRRRAATFDPRPLEGEVAEQLAFYHGMPLEQFQLGTALNELTDAIRRYHVLLPPPLALLLRVLVMLEGTGRMLSPDFNLVELLEPYQRSAVLKKLSPRRALAAARGALVGDWDDLIRVLPRQVANVLRDAPAAGDGGAIAPPAPGAVGEPAGVRADGERACSSARR